MSSSPLQVVEILSSDDEVQVLSSTPTAAAAAAPADKVKKRKVTHEALCALQAVEPEPAESVEARC